MKDFWRTSRGLSLGLGLGLRLRLRCGLWTAVVFVLGIGLSGSVALASGARDFGPYLGVSLSKNMATVQQPGVNASLDGWGNAVEVGLDLPFTDTWGLSLSAELGQDELRNKAQSTTYLDDTKISTRGIRGSLFIKSFYLGGSYLTGGADLTTISTTSGASSAHVDLTGSSFFAGYAISYKNLLRAQVEGGSTHFGPPGFQYTDYNVSLKLQFLIAGFLDHN